MRRLVAERAQGSVKCAVTSAPPSCGSAHVHLRSTATLAARRGCSTKLSPATASVTRLLARTSDPTDPSASYVYYTTKVVLAWVPSLINSFIGDVGLPKAVGWLRRESGSVTRPAAHFAELPTPSRPLHEGRRGSAA